MTRHCCKKEPSFKILFNGGSMGNDEIFVCDEHIGKYPFNQNILKREVLIK